MFRERSWKQRCTSLLLGLPLMITSVASFALTSLSNPIPRPVFNCSDVEPDDDFVNFESGQVRPLALSPDNKLLFVANTPANCLEIYSLAGDRMKRVSAVQVGMEPVAVAARSNNEIWVVNHLSDSISVVDISYAPYVKRTLQVGDEPRDIVFAGSNKDRAFITTAHRGQSHPTFTPEELRTPGIGRADVWVFDGQQVDRSGFGRPLQPLSILSLFTDTPRALAVSPDGKKVYAAGFLSGNQTTTIDEFSVNYQQPLPITDINGEPAPRLALIVKFNGSAWVDETGTDWSEKVMLSLPDKDVFVIDADAEQPTISRSFSQVGTVLFNMAVNPVNGNLYVSNTDANNAIRFEGPGNVATTVRGRTVDNRITVIAGNAVTPVHLNEHIDFSLPIGAATAPELKARSLAQPMEMQVTNNGEIAYVAAFSSNKIAAIPTHQLDQNNYVADAGKQISVPGGPTGLVLNADNSRIYVYSRFDNLISVIDVASQSIIKTVELYNPEPEYVSAGRPFLYDADLTSGNGTGSCGSCHVFGDFDALSWDLGNPDDEVFPNPLEASPGTLAPLNGFFHPVKGPMTTQTLRGVADSGPMHWRGDRTGTNPDIVNGVEESQEAAAFKEFNKAFVGLVGRTEQLSNEQMQQFADFGLSIKQPPNPIRNLDNSLTPAQDNGQFVYFNGLADAGFLSCGDCHILNPETRQFGTDRLIVNSGGVGAQEFKVPPLRNLYQKVGMFGGTTFQVGGEPEFMGDQVRGFGFQHDGNVASIDDFIQGSGAFTFETPEDGFNVADFIMAYETTFTPITGHQVTISAGSSSDDEQQLKLMIQQALTGNCDLEAHGYIGGISYLGRFADGQWDSSTTAISRLAAGSSPVRLVETLTDQSIGPVRASVKQKLGALYQLLPGAITFTCKPVLN